MNSFENSPRLRREMKTIRVMIALYCRAHHGAEAGLCEACRELCDYAEQRLEKCPYQESKTTCAKCPAHCYKASMREKVREVMRYAGPRMALRHPVLTFYHFLDGRRKTPVKP
jgi:hypothetical protein